MTPPPPRRSGRYTVKFRGGGDLAKCRQILIDTLKVAISSEPKKRANGLVSLPMIPWQNRPTQQQVVEVVGHRPG